MNKDYNVYQYKPKFFDPPLQYNTDGSDKDFSALFKPGKTHSKRDDVAESAIEPTRDSNIFRRGHVIISRHAAHGAVDLCQSASSRGPSFVSIDEKTYCDMSTKTHYPLCSSTLTGGCFDVDTMELIGRPRRHVRDLETRDVRKRYVTHEVWEPSQK